MALQNVWLSICFKRIQEHPHDRWISVPLFVCRWTELAQRPGGAHEAHGDTPPTSCFTSDATDILFHLGLFRALCHPLRHKANMCHLRSRCTASSTRSEHVLLASPWNKMMLGRGHVCLFFRPHVKCNRRPSKCCSGGSGTSAVDD